MLLDCVIVVLLIIIIFELYIIADYLQYIYHQGRQK